MMFTNKPEMLKIDSTVRKVHKISSSMCFAPILFGDLSCLLSYLVIDKSCLITLLLLPLNFMICIKCLHKVTRFMFL